MELKQKNCTIEDMLRGAEKTGVDWTGNADLQAKGSANHAKAHSEGTCDMSSGIAAKPQRTHSDRTRQKDEVEPLMQATGFNKLRE
jgi:hypothetical protein